MSTRILLFALLLGTSCSILFPTLLPDECETEGPIRCEGEQLVSCIDKFIVTEACAPGVCVEAQGTFFCEEAICGNDTIESSEDCEGQNLNNQNCQSLGFAGGALACLGTCEFDTSNCIGAICGDNVQDKTEGCDDGNQTSGDGCNANCFIEPCGDDIKNNTDEACDGADLGTDDCFSLGFDGGTLACQPDCFFDLTSCTAIACGNGIVDGADECDDGNTVNDDGCDDLCIVEFCGDGTTNFDEVLNALDQCDDDNNTNGDGCSATCLDEVCGDGVDNNGVLEQCDDGNAINGDACDNNCTLPACGNGITAGAEQCDDANAINADGCDNNCTNTGCPNGIQTAGEECDDGNQINNDGCTNACLQPNCGNGIVEAGIGEQCDDANQINGDTCDNNCTFPACGNGIVTAGELCDDGNLINGDGCTNVCVLEVCGDGVDNNGNAEQCDDGNSINGDACDSNCTLPACGNGITAGAEQCDDGNQINGDGCTSVCIQERCGDGVDNNGVLEQCDDALGDTLEVLTLTANGCQVTPADHTPITGDDRGGIAISEDRVFYTGDNFTGAFDLTFLTGVSNPDEFFDGLTSDLSTGKVYSLGEGPFPITNDGGFVDTLLELDGITANQQTRIIELSTEIPAFFGTGIFAGPGRIVIHNGSNVFEINPEDGQVTDHGPMGFIPHEGCENWAYWGIAEAFNGELFIDAISSNSIIRHRVPDGQQTVIASFNNLGDMCSFTASPTLNRWYFHHEGTSQFNSSNETMGYCNATFSTSNGAPLNGDGCDDNCQLEFCGDGVDNNGTTEECDDGNSANNDGCENDCTLSCGSGIVTDKRVFDDASKHCYLGFDDNSSWQVARDNCAAIGGHLVTIHDQRENDLVFNMDPEQPRWIGLSDLEPPDGPGEAINNIFGFAYENGEIVDFENFALNEPNDFEQREDCIHFFGDFEIDEASLWNDIGCTDEDFEYVCEIDTPICGNTFIEGVEECDDGNAIVGDGCDSGCLRECGNGVINPPFTPSVQSVTFIYLATDCTTLSTRTFTINGVSVDAPTPQNEFCDCTPGIESFTTTDPTIINAIQPTNNVLSVSLADADSFLAWAIAVFETSAGNGSIEKVIFDQNNDGDALFRESDLCSAGDIEGPVTRNTFPFNFTFTETCDDNNVDPNDGCTSACQNAVCGDGFVDANTEECDDKDPFNNNGCKNDCSLPVCGDGILDFSVEDCDGSDLDGADCTSFGFASGSLGCISGGQIDECTFDTSSCVASICGNTIVETGELCDDGNTIDGDGCSNVCLFEPVTEIEPNDDGTPDPFGDAQGGNDFNATAVTNALNNGSFTEDTMIQAAINPVGDEDVFAVSNPSASPVNLHVETFGNAAADSCGFDIVATIRDSAGTILEQDDDSGIPFCSRIVGFVLAPGATVFVQITDFDDDNTTDPYFLLIDFQ